MQLEVLLQVKPMQLHFLFFLTGCESGKLQMYRAGTGTGFFLAKAREKVHGGTRIQMSADFQSWRLVLALNLLLTLPFFLSMEFPEVLVLFLESKLNTALKTEPLSACTETLQGNFECKEPHQRGQDVLNQLDSRSLLAPFPATWKCHLQLAHCSWRAAW